MVPCHGIFLEGVYISTSSGIQRTRNRWYLFPFWHPFNKTQQSFAFLTIVALIILDKPSFVPINPRTLLTMVLATSVKKLSVNKDEIKHFECKLSLSHQPVVSIHVLSGAILLIVLNRSLTGLWSARLPCANRGLLPRTSCACVDSFFRWSILCVSFSLYGALGCPPWSEWRRGKTDLSLVFSLIQVPEDI